MTRTAEELLPVLERYASSQGIELNRDREYVIDLIKGLLRNEERYGYRSCPCRLAAGAEENDRDIICPCIYRDEDISEYGSCYCGLYVSEQWNNKEIIQVIVPERRQARR
jgi:ferredoxin-thioredoxin reductase catalytic subunit